MATPLFFRRWRKSTQHAAAGRYVGLKNIGHTGESTPAARRRPVASDCGPGSTVPRTPVPYGYLVEEWGGRRYCRKHKDVPWHSTQNFS